MRILYIAPRYHTNQIPVMEGLTEHGHQVCFVSHYVGKVEDYSCITPVIAGYSKLFLMIEKFYISLWGRKDSKASDMKLKYGFPPMGRIREIVKKFEPEVVIVRERSVYSIFACQALRHYSCIKILYNQSPLWEKEIKTDLPHRIVKSLLPAVRMTPVLGNRKEGRQKDPKAFFVPFVMKPELAFKEKQWFCGEVIRLLCVGKYEQRKNIHMLLEVFNELQTEFSIKLTIIGECSNDFQLKYRENLQRYMEINSLQEKVRLCSNFSRQQMKEAYQQADLFVLPSTAEPASISQLEAMSFSVPVICSDTNGTACYVDEGETGYLFKDNSKTDLEKVMRKALYSKERLKEMGKNSYDKIMNSCSYERYYQGLCQCMEMYPSHMDRESKTKQM